MIENRLSEILGRKRMNVSELARGAGISRSAAHKLYHDTATSFDRDVLSKVCGFLGVQVGDLLVYTPIDRCQGDVDRG
ncbi:MAG: helix-turn-helix transcriptional regulator [Chloroflexota bacterium]|nr:helix-turn-helix transcriptional regulator [Chloroflexota bacterium]